MNIDVSNPDMKPFTEKQIEQEIQDKGLNAPRLTPADIDAVIVDETYTNLPDGRTVICQLTLKNGFTVDGKSACVSKENFNQEIGNKIARDNAREKIWELEGYLLKENLYREQVKKSHVKKCTPERQCVNCWSNQGTCEALPDFLSDLDEISYKHGLIVCVTEQSGDSVAVVPMSYEDRDLGASYQEVIKGSGFIQF